MTATLFPRFSGPCRRGLLVSVSVFLVCVAHAQDKQIPSEAEAERILQAVPDAARAAPARPRRILVFNGCNGFNHSAIPYGAKALELMGEKTGAFETVITDDASALKAENLNTFDALVMNNTTMRLPILGIDPEKLEGVEREKAAAEEAAVKSAIVDFVRNGGGLIGIHAATDCFYKWPEYGEMIGGYFWGHPWNEEVTVKLDDPGHPLCRAFNGMSFSVADEIYQFKEPYSRDALRVLLSLDITRTNMNKGDKIHRTDGDFAVAWIREYGRGRVFYCSLGHRHDIFWTAPILQFYLDGIQYALGDLPADATPSAQLSDAYLERSRRKGREAGLNAIFADLAGYQMGVDDSDAKLLAALVLEAQAPEADDARKDLSRRLAALLRQDISEDCTRFACRQLALIGTEEAVPALAPLLLDPAFSDVARYALQRIPGGDADAALLQALAGAPDAIRIGIIDSLGARGTEAAVPQLAHALDSDDAGVRAAAALALGDIGTADAADALLARRNAGADAALYSGMLICADSLAATAGFFTPGRKRLARDCYEAVLASDAPVHLRASAFGAVCALIGGGSLPRAVAMLGSDEPVMMRKAASLFATLPGGDVTDAAVAALAESAPRVQAELLSALATRGDRAALPAVLDATDSDDPAVRLAALSALERLGNATAVLPLAQRAAQEPDDTALEQNAARQSLYLMTGPRVDAAIEQAIEDAQPAVQCELIRALGERKAAQSVPVLLALARQDDRDVRKEALESLSVLASPEHLGALVDLLLAAERSSERSKIETMVVSIASRMAVPSVGAGIVAARVSPDVSADGQSALLSALGRIAAPESLPTLYAGLENPDPSVRKAAIKALAEWPDAAPLEHLREVSLNAEDLVHRVLALRGYARMLAMPSQRPMQETLALYREAFKLAGGDMEKKSLLAGLAEVCHPEALEIAKSYVSNPELAADALMAATRIMTALDGAAMTVSASKSGGRDVPARAIDNTRDTRWTSGGKQEGGEWFEIDLGYETTVKTIHLDAGDTGHDYPRAYDVYVSRDGKDWGIPVVSGQGDRKIFTISVPDAYGRFIRIVQTGTTTNNYWSIADLKVNGMPEHVDPKAAEADRKNWKISASVNSADAKNAIDGDLEKRWATGRAMQPGDWIMVDLGETRTVKRVYLDAAKSTQDYPRAYQVQVSTDGENWIGPIGMGQGDKPQTVIPVLPTPARYVKIVQTGSTETWYWSVYDLNVATQ
jgi:type 1 glutamine amidotransferase/HEAT repeat protein